MTLENSCRRYIDCVHCTSSGSQWVKLLNQTQCCSSNLSELDALFVSVTFDEKDCPDQLDSDLNVGTVLGAVIFSVLLLCGLIWICTTVRMHMCWLNWSGYFSGSGSALENFEIATNIELEEIEHNESTA
ncbi:unnamed protein product [Allacma fusca]|uniref:Uncharacterized protein n=1 Tax=Allacma fusca TaxID=39272 RepID=A0A8J2J4Y7_9HEXA|nr:unnamed protein product [Allacma fusca]